MPEPRNSPGPCMVRVVVRENDPTLADNPPIHDKVGDHNERYFRDWLTATQWWALRNNKTVSIFPQDR